MKIILLTELFWPYQLGGGERQFFELAKFLAKKHEVHVYSVKLQGVPEQEVLDGVHIHRIGVLRHPLNKRSRLPLPFYFLALLLTGFPDYDLIHCNAYLPCLAGFIRAKLARKPVTAVIHDVYRGTWGPALGHNFLAPLGDLVEALVCRLPYSKILTVSSSIKYQLENTFGIPEEKIEVCGSGIDVNLIDSVRVRKVRNRLIYVGRLVPHKHVEDLLLAVQRLSKRFAKLECLIVGDGVLRGKLEAMAKRLGIEKIVRFTGLIPEYRRVIAMMKSSEILVLPSTKEGFGLVVLEAMRCRTVPVVYRLPCYLDFSKSEVVFVPPRDVEALADSIADLLKDRKKLQKMREKGFRKAEKYDWKSFCIKLEKELLELVSEQDIVGQPPTQAIKIREKSFSMKRHWGKTDGENLNE